MSVAPITAEEVFLQANISPTDFGESVIDPEIEDEASQKEAAIAHIQTKILPGAVGDVQVPLMKVSRGNLLPLPATMISIRYPLLDDAGVSAFNDQLMTLFNEAVKSYARSEINKQIASNATAYDADADQDRRIGDQKLKKLMDAVTEIVGDGPDIPGSGSGLMRSVHSMGMKNVIEF